MLLFSVSGTQLQYSYRPSIGRAFCIVFSSQSDARDGGWGRRARALFAIFPLLGFVSDFLVVHLEGGGGFIKVLV